MTDLLFGELFKYYMLKDLPEYFWYLIYNSVEKYNRYENIYHFKVYTDWMRKRKRNTVKLQSYVD